MILVLLFQCLVVYFSIGSEEDLVTAVLKAMTQSKSKKVIEKGCYVLHSFTRKEKMRESNKACGGLFFDSEY